MQMRKLPAPAEFAVVLGQRLARLPESSLALLRASAVFGQRLEAAGRRRRARPSVEDRDLRRRGSSRGAADGDPRPRHGRRGTDPAEPRPGHDLPADTAAYAPRTARARCRDRRPDRRAVRAQIGAVAQLRRRTRGRARELGRNPARRANPSRRSAGTCGPRAGSAAIHESGTAAGSTRSTRQSWPRTWRSRGWRSPRSSRPRTTYAATCSSGRWRPSSRTTTRPSTG